MNGNTIIRLQDEIIEVLVSSRSTGNAFCVAVQTSPPGGGPPPHVHAREDELFRVLDGDFELFDGHAWTPIAKDEVRFKARGQVHAFRNCGVSPGRIMFITSPGGLDEYLEEISPLAMPQDMDRLNEISRMYGISYVAPGIQGTNRPNDVA